MNKQLRMAGLVIILGLVLGFGYWQRQGSAAGPSGNRLEQTGNDLKRQFSPTSANKAFSPASPRPASAKLLSTITVTSLADGAATPANCPGLNCRLRDAIAAAADGDTVNFSVTGAIVLNSGELFIGKNLTIQGPGAAQLTISGNQASRVFNIGGVTVALSDLTVTKGYVLGNHGGNIYNAGALTITNCTISDGYTSMQGGGFVNWGSLTINSCTISGNSTGQDGGGIFNGGPLTIANTTISGNTSVYTGGGIRTGGGDVTLINCTISGNQGSFAGGVSTPGPGYPVYVRNTIISGNIETSNFGLPDVTGWETNLGNNLIGGNPLLAPLGNYGGPIQTYALLPGSPAINAGDNCVLTNTCASNNLGFNLTTDQRGAGFNRQAGAAVDIGAFESRGFTTAISGGDNQSANTNTNFANPLAVMVTAAGAGEPVEGGRVTFTLPASGASATIAGNPATIDSNGAAASGTVTANATPGSYTVQAGGPGLNSVSFSLTNVFVCPTITVSPAAGSLPAGTVGISYSQQFTQSGGAGAIGWGINPAIPGLSINSAGLLSGAPTTANTYNFTVTATDTNGCVGSTSYTLVIAKASQTITFNAIADKTFGDPAFLINPTSSSGLTVSLAVNSGPCTLSLPTAPTNVQINGAGSCTITASQAGNTNYNAAPSVSRSFTIAKATATLTLSNLNQTYNGSPRSVTVTTNPANLTVVSVTYGGSTTAPTNAGSFAVVASLNNANYQAANATGTLVIAKASQTITFGALANKSYGDPPFSVSATASSGLPVSFSAAGDCTVSGNTVTITRVGSCTITASQPGNTNYNAAPSVSRSFTIAKANQTITFGSLANKTYGDPDFTVSATASSGLAVSFSAAGNCTVTNSTVRLTGAGSCTITASQAGNNNYNAASSVSRSFTIAKATATMTLSNLNQTYNGSPRSVTVTTNPANLTVVSVTYNGSTTAPTNAGSYAVVASLNNANYQAANATGTLVIAKASQTITFSSLTNKTFGDPSFTVSATASSGLSVSFSATGSCTVSGSTVTLSGAGSCSITASQSGNTNYNAATPVTRSFTIAKANQTITFAKLADKTYGEAQFKLSATASSGLAVSFTASGACTVSLSTVTLTGAGSCTITATQAGNTNYNAATPVSQSFAIAKANQTIAFAPLPDKTLGDPSFKLSATASSGLAVSFAATGSCTVSGNTVTLTAVGSCTITASQAGNANYNAALPVSQSFAVKYPCQPITFGITSLPVGAVAANYSVTLLPTKPALAPFQFTVSGLPSGLTASITTTTVKIAGIPSQAGTFPVQINVVDANGCTNAGANNFSLVINKGTPHVVWFTPAAIYCGTPLGNPQLNALVAVSSTDKRRLAGTIVYTPPAGTVLSPGSQTLSMVFTPTDTANWNTATASVVLVVLQRPYITLNSNGQLTSNDGQYYTLTMDRMVASVTDGCATLDKNSVVVITQVTSDEPDDITKVGRLYTDYPYDGHTTDDIVIAADCKSVQLRDERDTRSDGRVYTISLRITGNSAAAGTTAVFKVTLPVQGQPFVESTVKNTVYSNCR